MIDLVSVIIGAGRPFFAAVTDPMRLGDPVVTRSRGVTHPRYEVLR